ncbi:hypothetical protein [Streptomyces sp. NPDC059176]
MNPPQEITDADREALAAIARAAEAQQAAEQARYLADCTRTARQG